MTKPVIIAGAGPAGCVVALTLAQANIPVLLLEKEPKLPIDLRASTFHPPTLEMLDDLGLVDAMLEKGLKVVNYQYRDRRSGEVADFDLGLIANETRFPFRLQLEQYELTYLVAERLKAYPHVTLRYDAAVTGLSQTDDAVSVTLENGEVLEGSFLVGADGASSVVRKSLGIEYSGFTYDEKFLVVSTSFPFEKVMDNLAYVNYVSDPDEWCVILRTDKLWRVLWPTDPNIDDEDYYLSEQYVQDRLQHLHAKDGAYDIGHRTLYRVHQRVAETYIKGRTALVGDSAHINNPLGGMGMNGGIHDAVNLADKLIATLRDGADYRVGFETYDRQRRNLAVKFVQEHTIQNKKLMESTDLDVQKKRQAFLMETAADTEKARAFLLERAMIESLRNSLAA